MFKKLYNAFTKVPVLVYFDLKQLIWLETDTSGYVIASILNQLVDT